MNYMSSYIDNLKRALEEAKNPMITCCKCHGKGVYDIAVYNESGEIFGWNPTLCELYHGTGKISLQFYEDLQRGCRR